MKNPQVCDIIRGIGEECDKQEISLTLLSPVRGQMIEAARRAFVDAIVAIGVGPDHEVIEFLNSRRMPFVTIDGEETSETLNVGIDHEGAAFVLMDYILSLGHREIAILCVKPRSAGLEKRLAGFTRALEKKGLSLQSPCIRLIEAKGSLDGGKEAAIALFDTLPRPTAVVAMADIIALGVYAAAFKKGLQIPYDISIAGFDGIEQGRFSQPTLTTLWQPGWDKGQKAAQMALHLLDGQSLEHFEFSYSLEIGGSTAGLKTP
jgi:DNA-binding LacI/PurR family transcriptional regulator